MAYRDPAVQFRAAQQIAKDHNCKIVEKSTAKGLDFLLYRIVGGRPIYIGKRSSVPGIHSLVCKACNFH